MEKRNDAQIYILAHKPVPYGIYDNFLYTPLQVGAGDRFLDLCEWDEEPNMNEWNGIYAETSGTYFIWKYCHPAKYKGQCQYRRRLTLPEDTNFDEIFEKVDVLAAMPGKTSMSLYEQYALCHSRKDIEEIENIVKSLYPDYADDFDNYIVGGDIIFYSNSFILRSEDYDKYCEWLFNVLGEFCRRRNWDTPDKARKDIKYSIKKGTRRNTRGINYQQQVCGFLSERLWTLYLRHNFANERIMCLKYEKFEGLEL